MNIFLFSVALFLFLNLLAGLYRAVRGPDAADRLMAAQLFGTTTAAILLLLAQAEGAPELRYLSLVFAALSVVTVVAFARMTDPDDHFEIDGGTKMGIGSGEHD